MNNIEMEKMTKIRNIVIIVLIILTGLSFIYGICRFSFGLFGGLNGLGDMVSDEVVITEDIDTINISADIADITIKSGDELKVEYSIPEQLVPDCNISNGTLDIISSGSNDTKIDVMKLANDRYNITLTVPADYDIKSLVLSLNLGDVNVDAVNFENFSLAVDLGDIELRNISGESLEVQCACGDMNVSNANVTNINCSSDMGDITYSSITCDTCTFISAMGDTEVEGTMNSVEISSDMGDIDLDTVNDESEIDIDVHTDLGDVTINGQKR